MIQMCDECAKEIEFNFIRVLVWGNPFDTFERLFCSPECMKKYTEEWDKYIFIQNSDLVRDKVIT
jgi:hypothetical protein